MKKKLRQYRDLLHERKDLRVRIRRETELIDQRQAYLQRLTEEQLTCEAALLEIEEYIKAVPDPLVRVAMRYRYIDGLSWVKVAMQIGGGNTADGCRMAVERYLSRKDGKDETD